MFEVTVGCKEKGKFDDFKKAFIVMMQEAARKFPKGIDQQMAETIWITDTEQKVKILKRISLNNAIARAKKEGMTKEDLGIT